MSIEAIRQHRGVPAKQGMRVFSRHDSRWGTIVSARGGYLRIRLDGERWAHNYHPTWMLDYYDKSGELVFRSPN